MKGQQKAITLLGGFISEQRLQMFAITAIAGTKDVRIDLISSSRKDLRYMVKKSTFTENCCFNLEKTQKAQ